MSEIEAPGFYIYCTDPRCDYKRKVEAPVDANKLGPCPKCGLTSLMNRMNPVTEEGPEGVHIRITLARCTETKFLYADGKLRGTSVKPDILQYCCDEFRDAHAAHSDGFITFQSGEEGRPGFSISRAESDYEGGYDWHYQTISFCPFCGARVRFEIVHWLTRRQTKKKETREVTVYEVVPEEPQK